MVLAVVLGVALVVTLLLSGLLRVPFTVSRYALRETRRVAEVYRAESALLACFAGFPSGYFDSLPPVTQGELGPWGLWSAIAGTEGRSGGYSGGYSGRYYDGHLDRRSGVSDEASVRVSVLVGRSRAKAPWPRYDDWADGAELYRQTLRRRIEADTRRLSGNRRFFRPATKMEYSVEAGDLTLDADGHVVRAAFYVEGSALLKGHLRMDTLLVYAEGPVTVGARLEAGWAEIYSGEVVRVEGSARLRGHVWGRMGVTFSGNARAVFPSVVLAMGSPLSDVQVQGNSRVEGVVAAPNGHVDVENTARWDSSDALFPFYVQGVPVAFEQKISR
ncbi:MAG: hypothetical protein IKN70_06675 [Fibrobacter sp.]|nr:hypothetical protein [Fibrobacter sp.]